MTWDIPRHHQSSQHIVDIAIWSGATPLDMEHIYGYMAIYGSWIFINLLFAVEYNLQLLLCWFTTYDTRAAEFGSFIACRSGHCWSKRLSVFGLPRRVYNYCTHILRLDWSPGVTWVIYLPMSTLEHCYNDISIDVELNLEITVGDWNI